MISKELLFYMLKNLWHRRGRSFLTVLSIFIGIATIFILVSFGAGLYNYTNELTQGSSVDKIIIQAKGSTVPGLDDTFKLTDDDLEVIEKTPGVYEASGAYFRVAQVKKNKEQIYTFVSAYDPKEPLIMDVFDIDVDEGRWLKSTDDGKVLLGYNYKLKDKIFSKPVEINDKVEVQGQELRVIGFLESVGSPQDDAQIYVTNDFIHDLYPEENLSYGWIVAKVEVERIDEVISNVEKELRKSRNLDEGKEDFFVQSFEELIESYASVLNIMIGFIILIALISILVSAINTANTMITSVLERTKEIGVMKSIGAKNSEIFRIFLIESSLLGLAGGIIGIALGLLVTSIAGAILSSLGWGFLQPYYPTWLFIGCLAFATLTGAISGAFPAYRASKTNIVEALRYE